MGPWPCTEAFLCLCLRFLCVSVKLPSVFVCVSAYPHASVWSSAWSVTNTSSFHLPIFQQRRLPTHSLLFCFTCIVLEDIPAVTEYKHKTKQTFQRFTEKYKLMNSLEKESPHLSTSQLFVDKLSPSKALTAAVEISLEKFQCFLGRTLSFSPAVCVLECVPPPTLTCWIYVLDNRFHRRLKKGGRGRGAVGVGMSGG